MHEQQRIHTKGFLLEPKQGHALLWLRRDGVVFERVTGSVPFEDRYMYEGQEYASRTFVQGESLHGYCAQKKFSLSMFVGILKSAMKGLQSLHERDIIHGKITGDNLILRAYDMKPVWVDHVNEGSKADDWDSFWSLFLSHRDDHDIGVEFFCAQLSLEENKRTFVETWSTNDALSLWDTKTLLLHICDGVEIPLNEKAKPQESEHTLHDVSKEQKEAWENWIASGKTGKILASLFLDAFPAWEEPTLLHIVSEGILLERMSPNVVEKYQALFGGGEQAKEILELAEKSVSFAQKVWDLEQEIERLESLSWYERNFGETKEMLLKAKEEFTAALQKREEYLPKLVPKARGLLDNEAALRIAQKKQEKTKRLAEEEHDWRSWFPQKIYTPQSPFSLGVESRSIDVQGEPIHFRRMPQGFWGVTSMNHSMWVSQGLITQRMYRTVTGNQSSWLEGADIPAHMMTYADALHFCNRLSEMFSLPAPYLFAGGTWSCVSKEGFRLLSYEEFCYVLTASGVPAEEEIYRQAWCSENSQGKIQSVRTKEPNDWGLYDIIGGMEEWVWIEENSSARVGGSWYHDRRAATNLRMKVGETDLKADTIGFRIVLSNMIKEGIKGVSLG